MWRRHVSGIMAFILSLLVIGSTAFADIGIEDGVSAYLIGDYETGEILEGYNVDGPVEIASISKLMSYLIIMDHIHMNSISLGDRIYIDEDIVEVGGSSLELEVGESFTVEELLRAVMVVSANDATYALARHVAGSEESFVKIMNSKARELGLNNSIYINSTGLPHGELQNVMSPEDIFMLSKYILDSYPETLSITTIPFIEVPGRDYRKENTNPLLDKMVGIDGLKTGFTDRAGHCLVATLKDEPSQMDEAFRLIGIIMGAGSEEERGEMGEKLMLYGMDNYHKKIFTDIDKQVDMVSIPKSKDGMVEVYPTRDYSRVIKYEDDVEMDILIDTGIYPPLKEGDIVGKLIISINGEAQEEIDLMVNRDIKRQGPFNWMIRKIGDMLFRFVRSVKSD